MIALLMAVQRLVSVSQRAYDSVVMSGMPSGSFAAVKAAEREEALRFCSP